MRLAVPIVLALVAQAGAMPVDLDEMPARRPHMFTCPPNTDWNKLQRCMQSKDKVVILRDLPSAKLVRRFGKATASPTISLYMRVDGTWNVTTFSWSALDGNEVTALTMLSDGALQLEATATMPTSVILDGVVPLPALLRRKYTTICTARAECNSVQTSCDMWIHGKAYWWFRGKAMWDGQLLRVDGDATNAGSYCEVPRPVRFGGP